LFAAQSTYLFLFKMAPKGGLVAADPTQDQWINVTWMPHTALSQTSHVCMTIRSAQVVMEDPFSIGNTAEWIVRVGIYGVAGLPLTPILPQTKSAEVVQRTRENLPRITVRRATHQCVWDYFVQMPIRWRDLPRDSYLHFEILCGDQVISQTTMPFFSQHGKLSTGLQKLALSSAQLDPDRNYGLAATFNASNIEAEEEDPVWKAVLILDQLERMEARLRSNPRIANESNFGTIPCVPWLDAMMKERALKEINEAIVDGPVRDS
jgi:Phosphoinositide 3-kinase C2